ncbi:MAG TPA: STN domain-containing protein, partial [Chitinophagaceae bacterium]|nr:STN domain-containing protein [Chitinophagaceae bacterium]
MRKIQKTAFTENGYLYLKIARIMKLMIALLLFTCLHVSAKGWSQEKITLKMTGTEIKKVLFAIEKRSNYRFLFTEDAIKDKPPVSIDVVQATIPEILDKILANTGIAYKVLGTKLVVLKEGATTDDITAQEVKITGRVSSESGESLAGVSVS